MARAGGRYRIRAGDRTLEASLRGRMKQEGAGPKVLVGDRVRFTEHADGSATIEEALPRRSVLRRRSPGRERGIREIAANVDQVVVVGAADQPAWDPCLADRFLAVAAVNDLPALLVINKVDLVDDASALAGPYRAAEYAVVFTSAETGTGIDTLREALAGRVSLFTGPTGVGKSSLLNAVQPGLSLRTAAVSRRSRAGRHTTVSAEMHPLSPDGFVVDTPGLRDIGWWGVDPAEVEQAFPEIAARAEGCRFDDCRHLTEPGCAVREAVKDGDISSSRYNSYSTMLDEVVRASRIWE